MLRPEGHSGSGPPPLTDSQHLPEERGGELVEGASGNGDVPSTSWVESGLPSRGGESKELEGPRGPEWNQEAQRSRRRAQGQACEVTAVASGWTAVTAVTNEQAAVAARPADRRPECPQERPNTSRPQPRRRAAAKPLDSKCSAANEAKPLIINIIAPRHPFLLLRYMYSHAFFPVCSSSVILFPGVSVDPSYPSLLPTFPQ